MTGKKTNINGSRQQQVMLAEQVRWALVKPCDRSSVNNYRISEQLKWKMIWVLFGTIKTAFGGKYCNLPNKLFLPLKDNSFA